METIEKYKNLNKRLTRQFAIASLAFLIIGGKSIRTDRVNEELTKQNDILDKYVNELEDYAALQYNKGYNDGLEDVIQILESEDTDTKRKNYNPPLTEAEKFTNNRQIIEAFLEISAGNNDAQKQHQKVKKL